MAETDDFHAEDQLNYEAETGEGGEGDGDEADIGDDPELEAIKVLSPRKYFATDTMDAPQVRAYQCPKQDSLIVC